MKEKEEIKNIIVGVTGSIAAYKACEIVSRLRKDGYTTRVIMTGAATKFITPLTLETLSGNRVYCNMFEEGDWQPEHVRLAELADLILVAPATADVIAKLAAGIADELLTSVVLAAGSCPVVVAPAMNEAMYNNKITQANIKKLRSCGLVFVAPEKGWLACGSEGAGRLAEPLRIVERVKEKLVKKNTSK